MGNCLLWVNNSARASSQINPKEDSIISSRVHKNYCISVDTIPDAIDSTQFVPMWWETVLLAVQIAFITLVGVMTWLIVFEE